MSKVSSPKTLRWLALAAALIVVLGTLAARPTPAQAANTEPFTVAYTTNTNGAIVTIGNALLTCPPSSPNCTAALAGGNLDNNNFVMVRLDADSDPLTISSSASQLNLPTGASVLWAGLYWGARLTAGSGGQTGSGDQTRLKFKTPALTAYQTITANKDFGPNTASYYAYQEYADVTALVRAGGNGTYWAADVVTGTGADRYAGWSLTVAYQAPSLPLRNLTVFHGFNIVGSGAPQTINISGFTTPQTGAVNTGLTMVVYEGDRAQTGDYTRLNSTQLGSAMSPGSNFFNSSDDYFGSAVATNTPNNNNLLGFDIKNLSAAGVLGNRATSASFTFSSNGDVYYPGVLATYIDLYAPDFSPSSKTVVNLAGNSPALPGDMLQYTVTFTNTGQDGAANTVASDVIPAGTEYVPGSLRLLIGWNAGGQNTVVNQSLTDAMGDDAGGYDSTARAVKLNLGQGASGSAGGNIPIGTTTSFTYQLRVLTAANGTTLVNQAHLGYQAETSRINTNYDTNPVNVQVARQADVGITKAMAPNPALAGDPVTTTLKVKNLGPNLAANVRVTDLLPPQLAYSGISVQGRPACPAEVNGQNIGCALGDLANGEEVTIVISATTAADLAAGSLVNTAMVSTDSYDPDLTNNSATATAALHQSADLAVTKSPTPATVVPGEQTIFAITVTNRGPSTAQNVSLIDQVAGAGSYLSLVSATPGAGLTCGSNSGGSHVVGGVVSCQLASLAPGQSAGLTVTGLVSSQAPGGSTMTNVATVSSTTPDANPANNTAEAQITAANPRADIGIVKAGPAAVTAGGTITYTLTATNYGPSLAQNVVITDSLPTTITNVTVSTNSGSCDLPVTAAGRVSIRCTATLAGPATTGNAGGSAVVTVTGVVAPGATGNLSNAASADPPPGGFDDPCGGPSCDHPNTSVPPTVTQINAVADLMVTKTADIAKVPQSAASPPEDFTYTIIVVNYGPSVSHNAVLTDQLPGVFAVDSVDPPAGLNCDPLVTTGGTYNTLTCGLGEMAVGQMLTFEIKLHAPTGYDDTNTNDQLLETVRVDPGPGETDPFLGNNAASWNLSDDPQADLWLQKAADGDWTAGKAWPANDPDAPSYTLTVTNNGPDLATRPVVTDTLPAGVHIADPAALPTGCSLGTSGNQDTVTCLSAVDLADGDDYDLTFQVKVDAGVANGSSLTNSATVVSTDGNGNPGTLDPSLGNNTDTVTTTVQAVSDVIVANAHFTNCAIPQDGSVDPVYGSCPGFVAGQTVTTIPAGSAGLMVYNVSNAGPSVAENVQVRFHWDHGMAGIMVGGNLAFPGLANCVNTGANDEDDVVCDLASGSLAPGQDITIAIPVVFYSYLDPGTVVAGHVKASTTTPESDYDNNDAAPPMNISAGQSILEATKAATPSDLIAGQAFTYVLTVTVPDDGVVSYVPFRRAADATGVQLTDNLPTGFTATAVSASQGSCAIVGAGARVTCDLERLGGAYGSDHPVVTVTISGQVADSVPAGTIPNTAQVTTTTPNTPPAEPTADVTLTEESDLAMHKTALTVTCIGSGGQPNANNDQCFMAGGLANWLLTVTNNGPSDADDVTVTDTLAERLTLDPATSDPRCAVTATDPSSGVQTVTCRLADPADPAGLPPVPSGSAVTFLLAAKIPANALLLDQIPAGFGGPFPNMANISNQASVYSPTDPHCPASPGDCDVNIPGRPPNNDSPPLVVPVTELIDEQITGSVSVPIATAGTTVTYSFTTANSGPSAAENPVVTITLPTGFEIEDISVPAGLVDCQRTPSNQVTCMAVASGREGAIAQPGIPVTGVITVKIPADYQPGIYDTAGNIATPTPESRYDNNYVVVPLQVQQQADTSVVKETLTDPVRAGELITYRLTIHNAGPSVAPDTVVSDLVPPGTTFQSGNGGICQAVSQPDPDKPVTVGCGLGNLAVGESRELELTFRIDAASRGVLVNQASVGSGALDPNVDNNDAEVSDNLLPPLPPPPRSPLPITGSGIPWVLGVTGLACLLSGLSLLSGHRRLRRAE